MAINTNKRLAIKWVRDLAKSAYEKKNSCYICGTEHELELHHFHSLTLMFDKWARQHSYDITTDEGVLAVREQFIDEHTVELYDKVRTLCNRHHVLLHKIYGKAPALGTEAAQERWVEIQKSKHETGESKIPDTSQGSFFSAFI
jgi:hypothetical protein